MVTQNTLTHAHKLKLRTIVTLSTLPFLAVLSAFGVIPQSEISFTFNQKLTEEITLPLHSESTTSPDTFWSSERVQRGDTINEVLRRLNVDDPVASDYLRNPQQRTFLRQLTPGKYVSAEVLSDGKLLSLKFAGDDSNQIIAKRSDDNFEIRSLGIMAEKRVFMRTGEINSTLFAATDAADLPDATAIQLADIFSGEIDFHRDLRTGDKFSVIYEVNYSNGEPVDTGNILAADFTNQGHTYRALYFEAGKNRGSYFSPEGKNMRKAFLRSPIEFSRISSGFKTSRLHPLLNTWRAHKGVDYAAAIGTKVKATADGVIDFVGNQGGYGNVIIINHQGHRSTVYGHLSKFAPGIQRGKRVSQGELIAYTGKTGLASGPHLHYEFKLNGRQLDPLRVTLPEGKPINANQKSQFQNATASISERLNMLGQNRLAILEKNLQLSSRE